MLIDHWWLIWWLVIGDTGTSRVQSFQTHTRILVKVLRFCLLCRTSTCTYCTKNSHSEKSPLSIRISQRLTKRLFSKSRATIVPGRESGEVTVNGRSSDLTYFSYIMAFSLLEPVQVLKVFWTLCSGFVGWRLATVTGDRREPRSPHALPWFLYRYLYK